MIPSFLSSVTMMFEVFHYYVMDRREIMCKHIVPVKGTYYISQKF